MCYSKQLQENCTFLKIIQKLVILHYYDFWPNDGARKIVVNNLREKSSLKIVS